MSSDVAVKIKWENTALDLRATPLPPLQIPMAEVNNRPVFKMNNDFWNHSRGPPQNMPQNLSNSNQNSPVPGSTNSIPAHSPSQQSNSSQIHVVTPGALALQAANNQQQQQNPQQQQMQNNAMQQQQNSQIQNQQQQQQQQQQQANVQQNSQNVQNQPGQQQQQQQNNQQPQQQGTPQQNNTPNPQQQQQQQQPSPHLGSPNSQAHAQAQAFAHQQMLQHQQQLGSGQNSPDKLMTEKIVNELQLLSQITLPDFNQLQRNSSAISERTLEECWTTLQRVSWLLFNRIFMHKSAMQMHARELTGRSEVKPHQCQQCLKSFSSNHQLVQHIRVHTGEKPYKCSYCDRRFKQLSHVQQHTRLHTGERPYKCHLPDCGRAFIQLSNLQQHLRNHDAQVERAKNRPFHCNICGKGFATESSLRTHTSKVSHCIGRLQQHAALIGGPNATSCPLCHKMFLGGEALMEHMKHTHKDPNASGVAIDVIDPYLAKRRTANHPCPVCGKHYVNEGSLRKHLACHPETSQLSSSLRMWPCSVCQAVFTHESGLLTHMEHMRMDPKHQFAAQYVLSRAAAERRERENLLGALSSASGSGLLGLAGMGTTSGSPMCASPSHSDSSSGNGRLSSAGSEAGGLNNNNNNCNTKLGNNGLHNQYSVEDQLHGRMAAIANMVNQGGIPPGLGSDPSAAANIANIANLAMRLGVTQPNPVNNSSNPSTPPITNDALSSLSVNAMNAMRASMDMRSMDVIRNSVMDMTSSQQSQQQQEAFRMQHAEALIRSQAETALRLAMSQALPQLNQQENSHSPLRHNGNYQGHQGQSSQQLSPDLTEALRLQEQRLEQALRLHGSDPRSLGFSLSSTQQNQQQP
ncbi:histone-lysine N-methyltransferase PRDM9 isoform X4 [Aethina tumida]|uniref:histone-lysine N-methyltransferase PRDM9 isoform X4 n=1 Tax=Aethina tumida TaxID=116153 RepID=UPI0021475415|nr:histone-lysine N-methyltransferase PRDM9 isoform X4 [Aethina tumida]